MRYRVLVELFYPTDPGVIQRVLDGEQVKLSRRGMKRVDAGSVVDDIPEASVEWLLAKGKIEPVPAPQRTRKEVTE